MRNKFTIKDSGKRQKFKTGAQRDIQHGKGRFDLLPMYALFSVARIFEDGALKYKEDNWRLGIPLKRFSDSAFRHLAKFLAGFEDENHAAMAAWNMLCLIETKYMIDSGLLPKELDNLPKWNGLPWDNKEKVIKSKKRKKNNATRRTK